MCNACYRYKQRTGDDRPERLWSKPPRRNRYCSVCGEKNITALNRCNTCYKWYHTHGTERPERLWNEFMICKNPYCREPLPRKKRRYKSLCFKCDFYWKITGKYLPKEYCDQDTVYCECGQVATNRVDLQMGRIRPLKDGTIKLQTIENEFLLCDDCLKLENNYE